MGRTLKIILILHHHNGLPHVPAFQLIRPCPHRCAKEIRLLHILPFQQMRGQNGHGHIIQKGRVGRRQPKGYGLLVHHPDFLHILVVWRVLGSVFRVHNRLDGKLHILRRKRLAVMPPDPLFQMKGIGTGSLVKFPALCQRRNHFIIAVMGRKAVEEQQIDFPVLIHGRIDTGIIAAGIDQRNGLLLHVPAAGCAKDRHRHNQQADSCLQIYLFSH